ncbi:MAG: hypothetical protein ACTSV2_09155 [Candidatus Thorarchaeota archaeon]
MKFRERWRLAGIIAGEVRFRGYIDSNPTSRSRVKEEPEKMIKSLKSASKISSLMSTVIITVMAVLSIAMSWDPDMPGTIGLRVIVSFSLFMLFSFAIIIFFFLLTTTGFFSSGCGEIPSLMPLTIDEVGNLILLTFMRTFLAPFGAILIVYPVVSTILLGPIVGIIGLIASIITIVYAMTALVTVSKWFYLNSLNSPDSKMSSVIRIIASFSVILGMVLVYGIINSLSTILHVVIGILGLVGPGFLVVLSFIFPFSFGIIAGVFVNGQIIPLEAIFTAGVASLFYSVLAIRYYRKTGNTLRSITLGVETKRISKKIGSLELQIVSPIRAVITRDLRLAARNIGVGIIFILPVMMLVSMTPLIALMSQDGLRGMTIMLMMGFANCFAGAYVISLFMIDTQGASILEGLPLSTYENLKGKTAVFMVPYTITMICLTLVLFLNSPSSPLLLWVPIIQIPYGAGISLLTGALVFRIYGGGRAIATNLTQNMGTSMVTVLISGVIGSLTLVGYGVAFLVSGNYIISLAIQGIFVVIGIFAAFRISPKLLKD